MRYARIQFARDRRPIPTATLTAGALTAAALAVVGLPSPAAAQPSNSTDAFNSMTAESHPDWMSAVPDTTGLAALSIPGTHDTLAIEPGISAAAYETQQDYGISAATLAAQLNSGIRAIDIRVRIVNSGTAFAIHHTDTYEDANFDDVLTKASAFLAAHPGETILMDLHGECDADTTEGGSGTSSIGHCADDPSNATTAMRESIFHNYVSRYPGLFYASTVTGTSTAAMPTLGLARGHIVLTTFTGPRGQVYSGYGLTQLTTGTWSQYVENDYTQCGLDQKWSEAQTNLANAGNDTADMYTTYTSANCAPLGAGPADVAGGYNGGIGMNQRLLTYLTTGGSAHTGVVLTDYLGHSDIDAIISRNPGVVLSGAVPSGMSGLCLDALGGSTANGTAADLWTCNGGRAQTWTWNYTGETLSIGGVCLDVIGQNTAPGTKVDLWSCNGGLNQAWRQAANGELVGVQSGLCLDDPGYSTTPGTQLEIWTCNGGANQNWTTP